MNNKPKNKFSRIILTIIYVFLIYIFFIVISYLIKTSVIFNIPEPLFAKYLFGLWISLIFVFLNYYWLKESRIQSIKEAYTDYIENDKPFEHTIELKHLLLANGISDTLIKKISGTIYFQTNKDKIMLFENFHVKQEDAIYLTKLCLDKLQGIYKYKSQQLFNPVTWIKYVVFLPGKLLNYIGFNENSAVPKLLNVIYWLSTIIVFKTNFFDAIKSIIYAISK